MLGIKRLITRIIAVAAVAAVALTLLPSPAAADHGTKVEKSEGNVCGYSKDKYETDSMGNVLYQRDSNGDLVLDEDGDPIPIPSDKKYLMKYKKKNPDGPNEPHNLTCADNTDGSGGTAAPLTGSSTSASTIALMYAGHGSRTGRSLVNWCIDTMFRNAARVPSSDTTSSDGTSSISITLNLKGTSKNTGGSRETLTWHAAERVRDFDDLYAGAMLCASGRL
ncbi:hypothetical protein [Candidatus Poriferisodalis sp.]|uniref:hypothetical protein n=1 Tax=Candidatus Poriferisodalis sp. TaxID=3101277 RepID=UPI003B02DBFA